MRHLFLSYCSEESEFAVRLAVDIKNAGVTLWMDRLDIGTGQNWSVALREAINECSGLIAILSPAFLASRYCPNELTRAYSLGRSIFPVLLSPVARELLPVELELTQQVDFTGWHDEVTYLRQLHLLLSRLPEDLIGPRPNAETAFLNRMLAELESRRGVLEYVELAAEKRVFNANGSTRAFESGDEWGFSQLFTAQPDQEEIRPVPIDAAPLPITSALCQMPQVVIIGEPGAGKTTLLRHVVRENAHRRIDSPNVTPLPLLLYLPRWRGEPTFLDFIRSAWPFKTDPFPLIEQGEVSLYLDGLNELGSTSIQKVELIKQWLDSSSSRTRVVVTCRERDYGGDLKLNLPVLRLEPLNDEQVRAFAQSYLADTADEFLSRIYDPESALGLSRQAAELPVGYIAEQRVNEAVAQRQEARSLLQLARNPYMLSALILVFLAGGQLPANLGALFQRLIRALWTREYQRSGASLLPLEQIEGPLSKLAYSMIEDDVAVDVSVEYAESIVGTTSVLRHASEANYVSINGGSVRFYHQLMQEYFAAIHLNEIGVDAILTPPDFHEGFINKQGFIVTDIYVRTAGKWDEVMVMLCGITSAPQSIVSKIAQTDPYLAAECAARGITISDEIFQSIALPLLNVKARKGKFWLGWASQNALEALTNTGKLVLEDCRDEVNASRAMARIGGIKVIQDLLDELANPELGDGCRFPAWILGNIGDTRAVPGLLKALERPEWAVRNAAVRALGEIGDSKSIPGLRAALRDPDEVVRKTALIALNAVKAARQHGDGYREGLWGRIARKLGRLR